MTKETKGKPGADKWRPTIELNDRRVAVAAREYGIPADQAAAWLKVAEEIGLIDIKRIPEDAE